MFSVDLLRKNWRYYNVAIEQYVLIWIPVWQLSLLKCVCIYAHVWYIHWITYQFFIITKGTTEWCGKFDTHLDEIEPKLHTPLIYNRYLKIAFFSCILIEQGGSVNFSGGIGLHSIGGMPYGPDKYYGNGTVAVWSFVSGALQVADYYGFEHFFVEIAQEKYRTGK